MNLYHLKYFYDSAKLGSISKAAELNRIGQPGVTKAIQSLEAALGKKLILHERNRFRMTEEGEIAFQCCQKIFSATEELRESLDRQSGIKGEVRFACQSSMVEVDFLPKTIKIIVEKFPNIKINMSLGRTDMVKDWIKKGLIDFGVLIDNVDLSEFDLLQLHGGHFYLASHPNYKKNWQEQGIYSTEKKLEIAVLSEKYRSLYQEPLRLKMEIGSWTVIKKFVIEGLGVGLIPDYIIDTELRSGKIKLIEPKRLSIPYRIFIARNEHQYQRKSSQAVIDEFVTQTKFSKKGKS